MKYTVNQRGLMRCCLASLDEAMQQANRPPEEGDAVHCRFHTDNGGMIFRGGAWMWNNPDVLPEEGRHITELTCEDCQNNIIAIPYDDGIKICGICRFIRSYPEMTEAVKKILRGET